MSEQINIVIVIIHVIIFIIIIITPMSSLLNVTIITQTTFAITPFDTPQALEEPLDSCCPSDGHLSPL